MGRNKMWRQLFSVLVIVFVGIVIWSLFAFNTNAKTQQVPISQIVSDYKAGRITKIQIDQNKVTATEKDGLTLVAYKEASVGLGDYGITSDKVTINVSNPDSGAIWSTILSVALPFLLLAGFLWFMTRQARTGNNQAMSFGKSTARAYTNTDKRTTFEDVAGLKHAKQELVEVVEFLKTPARFKELGAEIPRGVLLIGPAGVGKTLLAKAVAGEAGVPFFSLSASEFVEMFVGVGASRVRDLFQKAKRVGPAVIFIDELDAIGRQRGSGLGGSHDEREQTLNQILVEMDGFDTDTNVIILAATNRPDVLDPALLRPGRFDRKVTLDLPDRDEREAILKIHGRNKPLAKDVNLQEVAKSTPGLSGADLRNVMNEAAILAARENQKKINQKDLRHSIEKTYLGPERTSHLMKDKERKIVAYHEAGHAIVGHVLSEEDTVHKVSIISRGNALGFTWSLPKEDNKLTSKSEFEHEVASLLAGRAAERLIFNEITTGAANDLDRATAIARDMVTIYGMSDLGPVKLGENDEMVFLGREMGRHTVHSEKMSARVDEEINRIIKDGWQSASAILKKELKVLHQMATALLEKETLEDDELKGLLGALKPLVVKA